MPGAELSAAVEVDMPSLDRGEEPPELVLDSYDLSGVAQYIQQHDVQNILVMCGAGVSVAAGIPDFRTPGTGLYANLAKYDLPYPEAVFTLEYLREKPEAFVAISQDMKLWPGSYAPTKIHHFLKALHDQGRLLRCFTQNVDCLERSAGVPPEQLMEAHGTFASAHCIEKECKQEVDVGIVRKTMEKLEVPRCPECGGLVKPDVVFFGEALPSRFFRLLEEDSPKAELLLIIGTSLQVYPFAGLIEIVPPTIPRVLINNKRVGEDDFIWCDPGEELKAGVLYRDVFAGGDAQDSVMELATLMGFGDVVAKAYETGKMEVAQREQDKKAKKEEEEDAELKQKDAVRATDTGSDGEATDVPVPVDEPKKTE